MRLYIETCTRIFVEYLVEISYDYDMVTISDSKWKSLDIYVLPRGFIATRPSNESTLRIQGHFKVTVGVFPITCTYHWPKVLRMLSGDESKVSFLEDANVI